MTNKGFFYNNTVRTSNYIGKGNWADDLLHGVIDDFKIFDRGLSQEEIMNES